MITSEYKIGILGGTFDPVHILHIRLALAAKEALGLHEVWLLPAGDPYFKHDHHVTAASDRFQMTALAAKDFQGLKAVDYELHQKGNTYTADTLLAFHEKWPLYHFYFICGADILYEIETWYKPKEIFQHASLAAAGRPGVKHDRTLSEQADYLKKNFGADVSIIPFEEEKLSSSEIRKKLKAGEDVSGLVPDTVLAYIKEKKLYQ